MDLKITNLILTVLENTTDSNSNNSNNVPALYIIENEKTGNYYIGATNNKRIRRSGHFRDLRNNSHINKKLQTEFNSNPDLTWRELPLDSSTHAFDIEKTLIELSKDDPSCLNIKSVVPFTDEHCNNISIGKTGYKHTEEAKEKFSLWERTKETKDKMSNSKKELFINQSEDKRKEQLERLDKHRVDGIKNAAIKNSIKICVSGIIFNSISEAARNYKIDFTSAVYRLNSPNFPEWSYA